MFNDQVFNGIATKRHTPATGTTEGGGVIELGSDEQNYFNFGSVCVTNIKYLSGKNIAVNRETFGNSGVIYNEREELQKIVIEGYIKGSNRTDLLEKIDFLKENISGKKILKIADAGQVRRVTATCTGRDFSERRTDINIQIFKFEFETFDYWEEFSPVDTPATFTTPYSFNINRLGNAEARFVGLFTITSAQNVTELVVQINESQVKIQRNFANGEIVKIDGEKMEVTVNQQSVGFAGWIPRLTNTNNNVTISSNGSLSVDMVAQYRPAYK